MFCDQRGRWLRPIDHSIICTSFSRDGTVFVNSLMMGIGKVVFLYRWCWLVIKNNYRRACCPKESHSPRLRHLVWWHTDCDYIFATFARVMKMFDVLTGVAWHLSSENSLFLWRKHIESDDESGDLRSNENSSIGGSFDLLLDSEKKLSIVLNSSTTPWFRVLNG